MPNGTKCILLVGQRLHGTALRIGKREACGCLCEFVESLEAGLRAVDRTHFDVVLADSGLPNGGAYRLIHGLQGTNSSLFFWVLVHHTGWWIPVVLRGRHQFSGAPLRRQAFSRALMGLLQTDRTAQGVCPAA